MLYLDDDQDGRTDEDCSTTSCTPSAQIVGDRIDNDCDGRTDEEICDGFGMQISLSENMPIFDSKCILLEIVSSN